MGQEYMNKQSLRSLTRAIKKKPTSELYYLRAILYANKKEYQSSLADFDRAIELDPSQAYLYKELGLVCYNLGYYVRAIEELSRAIELDPNNTRLYIIRGISHFVKNNRPEALDDLNKYLELSSDNNPYLYNMRGTLNFDLGQYKEAANDYATFIESLGDSNSEEKSQAMKKVEYCSFILETQKQNAQILQTGIIEKLESDANIGIIHNDNSFVIYSNNIESLKYLYHYTSIDVLQKILESGCIRFSNLKNVNDKIEKVTKDFNDFGRYCLISCWTCLEDESEYHWDMYAKQDGIRIKLPVNSFDYSFNVYRYLIQTGKINKPRFMYSMNADQIDEAFASIKKPYPELYSVGYTNNEYYYVPNLLLKGVFDEDVFDGVLIGKYKSLKWYDEYEFRYRILLAPVDEYDVAPAMDVDEFNFRWKNGHDQWKYGYKYHPYKSIDYIDWPIKKEYINNIDITIGPKCNSNQRDYVKQLMMKFCDNPVIQESALQSSL